MSTPDPKREFNPLVFERWGYRAIEVRPSRYTVRDPAGHTIGWISMLGSRFQARGHAQSISSSRTLGTFVSIKAATALVIGHYEMIRLRDRVSTAVRSYEAETPPATPVRRGLDRSPSAAAPGETATPQPPRHPRPQQPSPDPRRQ